MTCLDSGLGENIRGTTLGAVDTVAHGGAVNKNDLIAEQGRREFESGMGKLRSGASSTASRTGTVPGSSRPSRGVDVPPTSLAAENLSRQMHTQREHGAELEQTPGAADGEFPKHHREDAMANDPDAIAVGRQYRI